MASKIVTFTLNGKETEVMVKPFTTLAKALRERLGFTATKCGCYEGNCGSCTVLLNGEPVLSCILPAEDVEGQDVLTLEGLTPQEGLAPAPAGLPRELRRPVRLLHARHDHDRRGAAQKEPAPQPRRGG